MGEGGGASVGTILWRDLTVEDADAVGAFYAAVVGWRTRPHPMGGYDDLEMVCPDTGRSVAGICHARGGNASLPPQWLVYVAVDDVEASAARCRELGGAVIDGPRPMGESTFCVVRDPAGAVLALLQR